MCVPMMVIGQKTFLPVSNSSTKFRLDWLSHSQVVAHFQIVYTGGVMNNTQTKFEVTRSKHSQVIIQKPFLDAPPGGHFQKEPSSGHE